MLKMIIKNRGLFTKKMFYSIVKNILVIFCFFYLMNAQAQKKELNVDSLYYKANGFYKKKAYTKALPIVNLALNLAPNYIDIRVLRIRVLQRLKKIEVAESDIQYLVSYEKAITYKNLVLAQINLIKTTNELNNFIAKVEVFYEADLDFELSKAEAYLRLEDKKTTGFLVNKISNHSLNKEQKYRYRQLLKKIKNNQIGVYYDINSFMKEYPTTKSWHTIQLEYMKFLEKYSLGARVTYSKHFVNDAVLYELESYPVFSDKMYGFINISASSKADFFQNYGVKASLFYTVVKWIEVEGGFRYLSYNTDNFLSYVIGATSYQNKFYLNARVFLGPKINGDFIQNYQANVRYYYDNTENYVSVRVGTGISPDEASRFIQVTSNPSLNSYYATIGATKRLNDNYNISANIGFLTEELTGSKTGNQLIGNIGLKYRF